MKLKPGKLVQETLKWNPSIPMKTPGPSSQGRNWTEGAPPRDRVTAYVEGQNSPRQVNAQSSTDHMGGVGSVRDMPETNTYDDRQKTLKVGLNGPVGYVHENLTGLDAEETGDHYTPFYGEVTRTDELSGETCTGFLERNNYLDRI